MASLLMRLLARDIGAAQAARGGLHFFDGQRHRGEDQESAKFWVVSAVVNKRFMAAMINTFSSVKPRVVIFHMTASQLVRSIAPLSNARAVPNAVAHVSDGKALGLAESRLARKC
jgi:hypothetical protein